MKNNDYDSAVQASPQALEAMRVTELLKRYDMMSTEERTDARVYLDQYRDSPELGPFLGPVTPRTGEFYSYARHLVRAERETFRRCLIAREGFAAPDPPRVREHMRGEPLPRVNAEHYAPPRAAVLDEFQRQLLARLEGIDSRLERIANALERKIEDT